MSFSHLKGTLVWDGHARDGWLTRDVKPPRWMYSDVSIYNCHYLFMLDLGNIDRDSHWLFQHQNENLDLNLCDKENSIISSYCCHGHQSFVGLAFHKSSERGGRRFDAGLKHRWGMEPMRLMERNLRVIKKRAEKWKRLPGEVDRWLWDLPLLSDVFVSWCASRNVLASSIC